MSNNWKMLFVGDIVIKELPLNNLISHDLLKIINDHDIRSCNFEAPLLYKNSSPIPKIGPSLYQHHEALRLLLNSGFNLINLANNHIMDYGYDSLEYTINSLNNILFAGAGRNFNEVYSVKSINVQNTKIGFISLAEWGFGALTDRNLDTFGFAWINHPYVNELIINSKKLHNVLVVQIHAGAELVDLPLPEWRERYREIIDLGADVVIAHHPHVSQGWEEYNGKYIFYSLGNFYFDDKVLDPRWNKGYAVSFEFDGNNLSTFNVIPIEKSIDGVKLCDGDITYKDHLKYLSEVINSEEYIEKINEQSINLWNDRYKYYYIAAVNGILSETPWKKFIKFFIKTLLGRNKIKYLLLLHNIKIETHRYCVERALKILSEK